MTSKTIIQTTTPTTTTEKKNLWVRQTVLFLPNLLFGNCLIFSVFSSLLFWLPFTHLVFLLVLSVCVVVLIQDVFPPKSRVKQKQNSQIDCRAPPFFVCNVLFELFKIILDFYVAPSFIRWLLFCASTITFSLSATFGFYCFMNRFLGIGLQKRKSNFAETDWKQTLSTPTSFSPPLFFPLSFRGCLIFGTGTNNEIDEKRQ